MTKAQLYALWKAASTTLLATNQALGTAQQTYANALAAQVANPGPANVQALLNANTALLSAQQAYNAALQAADAALDAYLQADSVKYP